MEPKRVLVQHQGGVYAGFLIAERRDNDQKVWRGLVRFERLGRYHELWFPQGAVRMVNQLDESVPDEQWTSDAVNRFLEAFEQRNPEA